MNPGDVVLWICGDREIAFTYYLCYLERIDRFNGVRNYLVSLSTGESFGLSENDEISKVYKNTGKLFRLLYF